MPPMPRHQSTDEPIVEADVVDDLEGPVPAEEAVEGVPVLAEVHAVQAQSPAALPAVQAAAVAATGFVAGAATLALVRRHSARKLARAAVRRRPADRVPIARRR